MKLEDKKEMVSQLSSVFSSAQVGLLVDYRGLTMEDMTELRRALNASGTEMKVLKNRLAKIAVKDTPFESMVEQFVDTRALVFGTDPVGPSKVVFNFDKDNEKFKFITGLLVSGDTANTLDLKQVQALGSLPSREVLLAQLLGLLNMPVSLFVRTLNEVPAKFVRTLAAVAEAKGKE